MLNVGDKEMKLSSLAPETRRLIETIRWDGFIEKHEGPFDYGDFCRWENFEFMKINGFDVLLPVDEEHHENITILRCIVSEDKNSLTIFLKDTTYVELPSREFSDAGYVAVCDRFPGEDFFMTIFYHEWYMVENELWKTGIAN